MSSARAKLDAAKAATAARLRLPAVNQRAGVVDMYANPRANVGWGSTSLANGGRHIPFRISLDYQKLVFMYRGSWVIRAVVDTKPHDQLKAFPSLVCQVDPKDIAAFDKVVAETATLQKYIEARKWGRLFGGALGIIVLKGHNDLSQPLALEDVDVDSYKGLIVVDRWSGMSPSSELINDLDNPAEYGLPVYYDVYTEANQNLRVHHTRCLRFVGRDLPLFEKQIETYWGMSEIECILDELNRYDYGMAAVADLISRANVFAMQNPMLAQMLSGVGLTQQQLNDYLVRVSAVSEAITTNGLLILGEDEQLFTHQASFSGLSEVMRMQIMCLCGASGYPVSRLFGETQTGLNSSNEGDLQAYYDNADQERQQKDRPLMDKLIPIICMSTWGQVPDDLDYNFCPIRTMNAKEKAELAKSQSEAIVGYFNAGILGRQTVLREIQSASKVTELGTNVTDEMIEAADDDVQVPLQIEAEEARAGTEEFAEGKRGTEAKGGGKDADFSESDHPRDDIGRFSFAGSTSETRKAETSRLKTKYSRILSTPLYSEGGIGPAQTARFSQRQFKDLQENQQSRMELESHFRQLSKSDMEIQAESEGQRKAKNMSRVTQIRRQMEDIQNLGSMSHKPNGELKKGYAMAWEAITKELAQLEQDV